MNEDRIGDKLQKMPEETFAELREQFQKNREYVKNLYIKTTGSYEQYYVDSQDRYYLKNIGRKNNESY